MEKSVIKQSLAENITVPPVILSSIIHDYNDEYLYVLYTVDIGSRFHKEINVL